MVVFMQVKIQSAQYIKSIFEFLGFKDIQQVFIEGQSADPSQAQADI